MSTPDERHLAALSTSLAEAADLAAWLKESEQLHKGILVLAGMLASTLEQGHRVLTCGNGGSMCDAMHFAQELSGHFRGRRKALAAHAISDPSHLTCVANDEGFERVFARGVEAWGKKGDALVVFSTSGNSPNILAAVEAARAAGLMTYALLGRDGGAVHGMCNMSLVVPGTTSDRIQEVHIKIVHLLIEQIEARLFGLKEAP